MAKEKSIKKRRKHPKRQKMWAIIGLVAVLVALIVFLCIFIPYYKEVKRTSYNSKYKYDGASLIGQWQVSDNFDHSVYKVYEFFDGGKVHVSENVYGMTKYKDISSTYRVEGNNTLIITYSVSGVLKSDEFKFSIDKDASTLVLKDGKQFTMLERYNLNYNKDASIFGEWVSTENENNTQVFNSDYTGFQTEQSGDKIGSNNIVYSTSGSTIYYFIDAYMQIEGYSLDAKYVLTMQYKIENDVLTLTEGDKITTYTRRK